MIELNETLEQSTRIYQYKLGEIIQYVLEGEPYCQDSWVQVPGAVLWNRWVRGGLYILALCFLFVGVAIISDIFVSSIEMITSKKRIVKRYDSEAQIVETREVLVWNETVANLTLMALGSSAPEILLSTIETCINLGVEKTKDGLGVFTIIGSAAFNMLIIISVCISAVGAETKRIKNFGVFLLTSFWSMFAYLWLLFVLEYMSPGEVDLWEAAVTLAFFPLLVLSAYFTDKRAAKTAKKQRRKKSFERRASTNCSNGLRSSLRRKLSRANQRRESATPSKNKASNSNNSIIEKSKSSEQETFTIEKQLSDNAVVKWHEKHCLADLLQVFKNRFNKNLATDKIIQLVQLLTETHEINSDAKNKHAEGEGIATVTFLCPKTMVEPGESVATVEVIVTNLSNCSLGKKASGEDNVTKDDIEVVDSIGDTAATISTSVITRNTSDSVRRMKKPRLSVAIVDSAYGSTSSISGDGWRPRLSEITKKAHSVDDGVEVVTDSEKETEYQVKFETRDSNAHNGVHYLSTSGTLTFSQSKRIQVIEVPLIDNCLVSANKREFFVILSSPSENIQLGKRSITRVIILPNLGSEVGFSEDVSFLTNEQSREITITVERSDAALESRVSVEYSTELDSAVVGTDLELCDFISTSGIIVFEKQETFKQITIPCKSSPRKSFFVVLKNPINCTISPDFGMTQVKLCSEEDDDDDLSENIDGADGHSRVIRIKSGTSAMANWIENRNENAWLEQIKQSFNFGSETNEDGGEAEIPSLISYIAHLLSFNWKVFFAIVIPPTSYGGGYITFVMALSGIGAIVFAVEEFGNLLGCVLGLENAITGITIIALGTSLPDTFASRAAALNEQHADSSIGNVNGSNSVNVFLGLGVPWVISAMYNLIVSGDTYKVKTTNLSFSVTLFLFVGSICLATIITRRFVVGGELGGESKILRWGSSVFLLALWAFYSTLCSFKVLEYI